MSEENELDSPVLDALALGVEPVAPPADLRGRILAAAAGGAEIVPLARQPRRRILPQVPIGAVAAIAVVALLAGALIGNTLKGSGPPPPAAQVTHYTLSGHGPVAGVTATVTYVATDRIAAVTFQGLPALPAGKVYELWLITPDNRADPAGVFVPEVNGTAQVVVDRSLAPYKLMAVTVEIGPNGVGAPTQQPQIYGAV